jgi:GR25 family glycosyltransferase involved in LPS biosynthesis
MKRSRLIVIIVVIAVVVAIVVRQQRRPAKKTMFDTASADDINQTVPHSMLADMLAFDVYLINMDSAKDRLDHFKKMYSATDMGDKGFIRRRATDGKILDVASYVTPKALNEILQGEEHGYRTKHYELTRGGVGCYLSHMEVWQYIRGTDKPAALVLEDDVVLRDDFYSRLKQTRLPDGWDIVLLGYVCNICVLDKTAPGMRRVKKFFGMHSYLISRTAVEKILVYEKTFPIGKQIDSMLSDMISEGKLTVYATVEKLAVQNNRDFATQIQIPLKHVKGLDPWAME